MADDPFYDVKVYTGEKLPAAPEAGMPAMVQAKTQFMTAVKVQQPRDLDKVVAAVKREAALAGEAFYWGWPVKNKRTGKTSIIEGPSIGLAMCVAREWTNVAVQVDYQETAGYDIFTAHFIDLERGFTVSRVWRQRKGASKDLDAWGERAENMTFQAGQSRAIRNAVLAGVPKWLVDQAREVAKASVIKGITPEKIAAAREASVSVFKKYGVEEARMVALLGVPVAQWGPEEIMTLKGLLNQVKDGQATADELFPQIAQELEGNGAPLPAETRRRGKGKATLEAEAAEAAVEQPPRGITDVTLAGINFIAGIKGFTPEKVLNMCEGVPLSELTEEAGQKVITALEKLVGVEVVMPAVHDPDIPF